MQDLALFAIGHQRSRWLEARTAAVAGNVANADTPGYRARDVAPFTSFLDPTGVRLSRTQPGHQAPERDLGGSPEIVARAGAASKHSGNTVSIETEMATLGEARSQHAAVTGIIGAFHRMLLSSARG